MATSELPSEYQSRTEGSEEDQEWVGLCDAFPLASWREPKRDAAEAGIRAVVAEVLGLRDAGNDPQPPA